MGLDRYQILIIEDEILTAMSLQIEFESLGHEVVGILKDEATVLQVLASQDVSVILMDVNLGSGKSGLDIGAKIQARHDIPLLLMTGYEIESLEVSNISLKIIGVTKKPVFASDLLRLIDAYFHDQETQCS